MRVLVILVCVAIGAGCAYLDKHPPTVCIQADKLDASTDAATPSNPGF